MDINENSEDYHRRPTFLELYVTKLVVTQGTTLLLDQRSIDLNGAQEKEGHFHYKNFLRASK